MELALGIMRGRETGRRSLCAVTPLSTVDITLALLLTFSALRSYARGLVGTLAGFAAPVIAFFVARDWSDPAREWLAGTIAAPPLALDLLAPAVVFVGVVVAVRLVAAMLARLLGVGRSLPGRVAAAMTGVALTACVLGLLIVLLHSVAPSPQELAPQPDADDPRALVREPVSDFLGRLDRQIDNSVLGPRLAALADLVLREALPQRQNGTTEQAASAGGETR